MHRSVKWKKYFNKFESENLQNYVDLMNKTGFFKILERKEITNIKDYVFGLEVGLDSNARKNRVGKLMEELVENSLINFGYAINENYLNKQLCQILV
ncbi:type II restriction endonuclease [Mycoplasma sp. ES3157-GEN-MYC]|uniref:type II restriction endonuclease n=1 Tax=Mycoplasma miroungigenitalium TaxID=754515 RepID=UPI001C107176|nr:type II restriction endonuclease [Mycoplasma miroungigenitalium]MBU4690222.1 type II restriction endonuclease [Mycoplasma miroungigenitalium]